MRLRPENPITQILLILAISLILVSALSCKKKAPELKEQKDKPTKNEPAWVQKCGAAFSFAEKQEFYGCGSAPVLDNNQFQLRSADERARTDLAKNLDRFSASLFKDFLDSPAVREKAALSESGKEEFLASISRQVTEITLHGAQVLDRWRARDGTVYSILRVGFNEFEGAVRKQAASRAAELNLDPTTAMDEVNRQLAKRRVSGR
jgi:hypothetical protein